MSNQLYRPCYHFTPPANWMNDPNGLVYFEGEYHLFYQYHPNSITIGPMHWGHAVSNDLVNWQHLPIAFFPEENGYVYSGSAVVDWHNTTGFGIKTLVALFTHHTHNHYESQCLAYSTDKGRTWIKYSDNPVLTPPPDTSDFRDPKVFWYEAGYWVMVLASGNNVLFYTSPNLVDWQPSGNFGGEYGSTIGVWETPDLFQLPLDSGLETRWVLTVGVQDGAPAGGSGTQYFIGSFDGKTFTSENPKGTILWIDFGADYYAAQSWSDEPNGRRIMLAWQSNWKYARVVPTSTWRGAFSIPRQLSLTQISQGIHLIQLPIPELETLRGAHQHWQNESITPGTNLLANIKGETLEIISEFQMNSSSDRFGFRVRTGDGEATVIGYNPRQGKLFFDRSHSGQSDFDEGFASIHLADLAPNDEIIRLHIFIDRSSVEVFGNEGRVAFSESIFPSGQSQGLELFTEKGTVLLKNLDVYQLNPAHFSNMTK